MKRADFVHLHGHTQYSLLDGACRLQDLIEKARSCHMPALAITDHGNLFGAIEFYLQCQSGGVKPIIGYEAYVAPGKRTEKAARGIGDASYHLTLLVKNEKGYRNLLKLATSAYLEGFYYRPRIDKELLAAYSEGLIGLSGCLKGEVSHLILANDLEKAQTVIGEYIDIFGKGNFYLELEDHGITEQKEVIKQLMEFESKFDLPVVATNDFHYLAKEDAEAHEVLLCIQTGTTINDPARMRLSTDQFYFKSPEEMKELFAYCPQALRNTLEITEQCNLELTFGESRLPHFTVPDNQTQEGYLRKLCLEGLKKRYQEVTPELQERLDSELKLIEQKGYISYFLIVWDFIRQAWKKGIMVGPGRGSVAGSLVAYTLEITQVDPLTYDLLFERFLNPERGTMPDIDIDFCDDRREEIIDYVTQKYGNDRVAQIITFGTMAAKGVIRDVGRAMDMPYGEVDRIAKLIPNELDITIEQALVREPELNRLVKMDPQVERLIAFAKSLERLTRHASTHAAGVVIAAEELTNIVPLCRGSNGEMTTQYAMGSLEKIGLLKMDFLGLRTLTVIQNTLQLVKEVRGEEIKIGKIPLNDSRTFRLLQDGKTKGIFQLESSGMRELLHKLEPERIEDIIAILGLYRPGPLASGMVNDFIKRKHGLVPIEYDHNALEPILKNTYGVILYQEQIMRIVSKLAGFTLGQADILQRSISKKIPEVMEQQRENFLKGAIENKIDMKVARKIFDLVAHFAGYGFNKSHSTAYAIIAYQTAYLKANYQMEFMAALFSSELNNTDKLVDYIEESRELGIEVLPPDINKCFTRFRVVGNRIHFGLGAVKNVGEVATDAIVAEREKQGHFRSFYDFCQRVDLRMVNKRVVESLIKCGAFDSFGLYRSQLVAALDHAFGIGQLRQKDRQRGQTSFFDIFDASNEFCGEMESFPDIPEWAENKLLAFEKEVLGFYITSHPLARYEKLIKEFATTTTANLNAFNDGNEVSLGGIITSVRFTATKKGERMAVANFEDMNGSTEIVIFPRVFEELVPYLKPDVPLYVKGRLSTRDEQCKVSVAEMLLLEEVEDKFATAVHIKLSAAALDPEKLNLLRDYLFSRPGNCTVYLHLIGVDQVDTIILADFRIEVSPKNELIEKIREITGDSQIVFKKTS